MRHLLSVAACAGLTAAALLATAPALAHFTTTRCNGYRCYVYRCDDDGDRCVRIDARNPYDWYGRAYNRYGYDRYGYDRYGYDRDRYWRREHERRWVCDDDGDRCSWRDDPD